MYHFEHVVSPAGRKTAFRLRYEVYCKEKRWLDPEEYSDMQEKDEHDRKSETFLAYDSDSGQPIGTARLIIDDGAAPLHIVKHPALDNSFNTVNSVEISRMAILASARQGNVFIGLIRMLFRHILEHCGDFDYIYFSVEERFLKKVNQLGFEFIPFASTALWYCDQLVPARQVISEMDNCVKRNNPEFNRWLWQNTSAMADDETFIYFLGKGRKADKRVFKEKSSRAALCIN
ncbi:MAG: GNAT family N-acetyltransferase [Victivallaceae bacterium]|nr:GNAT family N-acetyltransferase [Victivallaceae bacterium]